MRCSAPKAVTVYVGRGSVAKPFTQLEYATLITPMAGKSSDSQVAPTEVAGGTNLSLRHEGLPSGAEAMALRLRSIRLG
jgi:hypothetical protein